MCYSAQIWASYDRYVREFGASLAIDEFVTLYGHRMEDRRVKIPNALDLAFLADPSPATTPIKTMIEAHAAASATELQQELFKQAKRLADAERVLLTRTTKKAQDDQRIATDKVAALKQRLADLQRAEPKARDARIFPGWYAPVLVVVDGKRKVLPMRYQCRPAGKPAFYDVKYPGTYNARRDNLQGFWKELFGFSHGVVLMSRFYENVHRDGKNVVLEFTPSDGQDMLVACLWSRWVGPDGEQLLSFAAITDDPPPEVAAAGHDRCIVPIRPENVDAWLSPDATRLAALHAILEDRARPYYEHRLAA